MQDNLGELLGDDHASPNGGFGRSLGLEERLQAEKHYDVRTRVPSASIPLARGGSFGRVIGDSPAMRELYPLCRKLAELDLPVVIEGETGTGKELLAESLHEASARSRGAFVVLDCTAIPPNLVESALFGHEKGSFTGATEARKGVFEEADGGTLLLDEIGDLDLDLQAKLLRALERSEISRVGSNRRIKVDVRFMAATRRNLADMVRVGQFRDDLFFRLAVTRVELPPLRERRGDLPLLVSMFWQRLSGGTPAPEAVIRRFEEHHWPGNVRELQNAVARNFALGELAATTDHLCLGPVSPGPQRLAMPIDVGASPGSAADSGIFEQILLQDLPLPEARRRLVAEFEQHYIERALRQHDGNVAQAAEASGVGSRYFRLLRARSRERDTPAVD